MGWENSRREFLKTGLITGATGFTGASKAAQDGQITTFSGTVTSPDGNPLPNADVIIYDAESNADQPATRTTTDSNGEFTFNQFTSPENPFLVVKHSDTGFYRSVPNVQPETFTGQPEIIPDSQLLYGPTLADQNTSTARGIITVWREFRAENQLLNIEVTSPPGDGSPTDSLRENALTEASFSFTVPETVYIDYENTAIIYTPLELDQYTERPNYILNWYPSKVGLPLLHSTGNPGNLFQNLTQQRIQEEEDQGQFGQMLVNTLLGEIPGYSTITGLGEVLAVTTGQDHETSTLQAAGSNVESPNRNEFDSASGVQPLYSYSTIYQVPIRFTEETGEEPRIVAEANWSTNDSFERTVADRFRFQENIFVTPLDSQRNNVTNEPASTLLTDASASANQIWNRTLPTTNADDYVENWNKGLNDIASQNNDGIACIASVPADSAESGQQNEVEPRNALLVNLSSDGTEKWTNTYQDGIVNVPRSITTAANGGQIFAGRLMWEEADEQRDGGWIVKISSDGAKQWSLIRENEAFNTVQQSPDDGYICGGIDGDAGPLIVSVDEQGNEVWSQTYGGSHIESVVAVDDGYVAGGIGKIRPVDSGDVSEALLLKVDSEGSEEWRYTYPNDPQSSNSILDVTVTQGGYLLTGIRFPNEGGSYCWVAKVGTNGAEQWTIELNDIWTAIGALPYPSAEPSGTSLLFGGSQTESEEDNPFWVGAVDDSGNVNPVETSGIGGFGRLIQGTPASSDRYIVATKDTGGKTRIHEVSIS